MQELPVLTIAYWHLLFKWSRNFAVSLLGDRGLLNRRLFESSWRWQIWNSRYLGLPPLGNCVGRLFPRSPVVLAKLIVKFSYMKCYPVNNKSFQNLTRNTEHASGTVTLSFSNIALLVLFSVVHLSRSEGEGLGLGLWLRLSQAMVSSLQDLKCMRKAFDR